VATISTTSTTIATTVSTISTTVLVEDGAATEGQPPAEVAAEKPNPKDVGPVVAPYTPLDFKIPDKAFREARKAADGSLKSYWNYSLYRGPGGDGALDAKVKVHYCTSSRTTERVIKEYFSKEKVLGFDLEWMVNAYKESGPRRNVSLVQLASPTRIGLFHLAVYPQKDHLVSPALKRIMEDPEITKVGVSIKGDCTRMLQFLNVKARGQFELSHLYRLVKYSKSGEYKLINKKLVALATQVKDCLGLPMFKGSDVRTSDWSQPLNMSQIIYSSSDAYAAVQLYAILNHQRENLDGAPPIPHHAELNIPIPVVLPTAKEEDADPEAAAQGSAVPEDSAVVQDSVVPQDQVIPQDQAVLHEESSLSTTTTTTITEIPQPESEPSPVPP
jgi:hypothetical protein